MVIKIKIGEPKDTVIRLFEKKKKIDIVTFLKNDGVERYIFSVNGKINFYEFRK